MPFCFPGLGDPSLRPGLIVTVTLEDQHLSGPQFPCLSGKGASPSGTKVREWGWGAITSLLRGLVARGHRPSHILSLPSACPQLLANAVIFLCGNLTGAFHKHQMQDASRDLFTYTVKCIQIRRKLRVKKRQQVWTLPPPRATARSSPALPGCLPGPTPCVLSRWMSDTH